MGLLDPREAHWGPETKGFELLHLTLGDVLREVARRLPEKEAVVYSVYPELDLDVRWTYSALDRKVDALARGLLAIGIQKADKIAVWSSNIPEWILLMFATARIGAVLVTVNTNSTPRELEYVLKQSDSRALFLMPKYRAMDYIERFEQVGPGVTGQRPGHLRLPNLPELKVAAIMNARGGTRSGYWLFEDIVAMGQAIPEAKLMRVAAEVHANDPVMIQYTSGTTGFPKGAMLSHEGILNNPRLWCLVLGLSEKTVYLNTMPFFHTGGCVLGIIGPVCVGATLVPMIEFDPRKVLEAIHKERATFGVSVPTMLLAYLGHPELKTFDMSSLRIVVSGGTNVPTEMSRRVKNELGADVLVVYGLTEASPVVTQALPDDPAENQFETIGRPIPHVEVKLIRPGGTKTVAIGEVGEICCRGFGTMLGYYKMPDKTRETIDDDGWLHTGDLAVMNAEGYLNIVGRTKDMIIRGGENIYPREIEELLMGHPKIEDAHVLGVPDFKWGEQVCAVIKPRAGMVITAQEVHEFLAPVLAHHKIPRYVRVVEEFPLTASGKVQKFRLREDMITVLGLEAAAAEKHA
jgi:fatty-acyl-CoA synthase